MQAQTPEVSTAKATTPRYDTIVIRSAKGKNVPKKVDGGDVVAWSSGHELAAIDALVELVGDLAAGDCSYPSELTERANTALALMERRRELGWEDGDQDDESENASDGWTHDKPTQPGAYWIRGNLLLTNALVEVKLVDDVLWCNLHQVNTELRYEDTFTVEQLNSDFEWLGPLAPMGGR